MIIYTLFKQAYRKLREYLKDVHSFLLKTVEMCVLDVESILLISGVKVRLNDNLHTFSSVLFAH